MKNMTNTGVEMVKVIDEAQALMMTTMMSELGSEIAEDENVIKALTLSAKTLKITKDMTLEQCAWFDETAEKIAKIDQRIAEAEAKHYELKSMIRFVNEKLDLLLNIMSK